MNELLAASLLRSRPSLSLRFIFFVIGMFAALLVGCGQPAPEAQNETPAPIPSTVTNDTPAPHPDVATALAAVLPTGTSSPDPEAATSATPTPAVADQTSAGGTATPTLACPPPPNWVLYTILPLDTLLFLEAETGVSVETIMAANCMEDDLLIAGEQIYLPSPPRIFPTVTLTPTPLPPTAAPRVQPPPPAPAPIISSPPCSPFKCPELSVDARVLRIPGPSGGFTPCEIVEGEEPPGDYWISYDKVKGRDLELGQRSEFFACGFNKNAALTAELIVPGKEKSVELDVLSTLPHYEVTKRPMDNTQGVVLLNPICDAHGSFPTEENNNLYTLVVSDDQDHSAKLEFTLQQPTIVPRILTIPPSAYTSSSTNFEVYFCGYTEQANKVIAIDFYYEVDKEDGGRIRIAQAHTFKVRIDSMGQGYSNELWSIAGDPARLYYIDAAGDIRGHDRIWLVD